MAEQSHCRKPDCKYHPQRTLGPLHFWWLKCLHCKHIVSSDNYKAIK